MKIPQNSKFILGEIEIFPIVELDNVGELIQSIIPQASKENIRSMELDPIYADDLGNLKAVVQCYCVKADGKIIIIDSCNGNQKLRNDMPSWGNLSTKFIQTLQDVAGVKPEDVDIVINTHLHFDHVGWNTIQINQRWEPTFERAKYIFVRDELDYWLSNPKNEISDDLAGIEDSVIPVIDAGLSELVDSNHQISKSIRLIASPGHTPGHVCVELNSGQNKLVIGGDLIYHPCQILGHTWMAQSDGNPELALSSRKEIFDYIIQENAIFMGMHFNGGLRIRKKSNQYQYVTLI